mmetsp:Transcript_13263/g.28163  ORF Transcript_13263/g.28163 Transcript_13263/m.28163 type:complete len:216 (+) Transcript_13263:1929-2576(+)
MSTIMHHARHPQLLTNNDSPGILASASSCQESRESRAGSFRFIRSNWPVGARHAPLISVGVRVPPPHSEGVLRGRLPQELHDAVKPLEAGDPPVPLALLGLRPERRRRRILKLLHQLVRHRLVGDDSVRRERVLPCVGQLGADEIRCHLAHIHAVRVHQRRAPLQAPPPPVRDLQSGARPVSGLRSQTSEPTMAAGGVCPQLRGGANRPHKPTRP